VLRQPEKIRVPTSVGPEPSQIKPTLEERVRLKVMALGRTSESKVGYWLGHILEERVSQSCFCRNPFVGVIVQHLLEREMYANFSDVIVDQVGGRSQKSGN
jgi:hypothetical protein